MNRYFKKYVYYIVIINYWILIYNNFSYAIFTDFRNKKKMHIFLKNFV
jgi:hypothetical protein